MLSYKITPFKTCLKKNNISLNRHKIITYYASSKNHLAFMKTHVIADYIEKLNNDINMVDIEDNEFECKNIQYFRLLLIIVLMIYMFTSPKNNKV